MHNQPKLSCSIRALAATGALALCLPAASMAQDSGSVSDYRLPPAPTPTTRPAGPVIPEAPIVRPVEPSPTPRPSAAPSPSPTPTAQPSATPAARRPAPSPTGEPAPQTQRPTPSPSATATPSPSATPSAVDTPFASETASEPAAAPQATVPPPAAETNLDWLKWAGAGGALLALLAALTLFRRKRQPGEEPEEALPQAPSPTASPPPLGAVAGAAKGPAIEFGAEKLVLSFMNARLTYRLSITNRAATPTGPIVITGDLTSAHASVAQDDLLRPAIDQLAPLHEIETIPAGQTVDLTGDVVLPLAQVRAIAKGPAVLMVPLARFHVARGGDGGVTHVFVTGEQPMQPGARIVPIRLDAGPRTVRPLVHSRVGETER